MMSYAYSMIFGDGGKIVRDGVEYSMPDQVARFANANKTQNARYLDITTVYDGSGLKGKRVLITGAEQGLGLELVKEILKQGGVAIQAGRTSSPELDAIAAASPGSVEIILGIDVTKDEAMTKLGEEIKSPVDILVNCAGYFYGPEEFVGVSKAGPKERAGHLNFKQEMLMIDICSVGPLRITNAVYKAGKLAAGGKVIIITSQAGSCEWRLTQNPPASDFVGNYGHHMSRASCNIMGVLLAQEFKEINVPVQMLHPGFNRTAMTKKYEHIWDIEGAVEADIGAKRVLYEILKANMSTTGTVINCEDGLRIPW